MRAGILRTLACAGHVWRCSLFCRRGAACRRATATAPRLHLPRPRPCLQPTGYTPAKEVVTTYEKPKEVVYEKPKEEVVTVFKVTTKPPPVTNEYVACPPDASAYRTCLTTETSTWKAKRVEYVVTKEPGDPPLPLQYRLAGRR